MHLSQRPQRLLAAALALSFLSPIGAAASPINSAAASDSSGVWRQYLQAISRLPEAQYRGAKPHHKWRRTRHGKALVSYPTQIEHVVVIVMENRTVDNLFAGFYGFNYPGGGTFGSRMNLCNPTNTSLCGGFGPLTQYNLFCTTNCQNQVDTSMIDPTHHHVDSFWFEAQGYSLGNQVYQDNKGYETFGCPGKFCANMATGLTFVPTQQVWPYATMFAGPYSLGTSHFAGGSVGAVANNILQSNEGPSWVAHQYLLSGQSGGYTDASTAPDAMAENPGFTGEDKMMPAGGDIDTNGTYPDEEDPSSTYVGCGNPNNAEATVNMTESYKQARADEAAGMNMLPKACSDYPTIVDEAATAGYSWEYIAHNNNSIWSAPLGVKHLYKDVINGTQSSIGFQVDPDAKGFVQSLYVASPVGGYPELPNLTYITPCTGSSDHPNAQGKDDGTQWLPWLINSIAQSPNPSNWQNTVFLVTWDDWGGWFDSYQPMEQVGPVQFPFHPSPNPYNVTQDANEWGFRVPLILISPYVTSSGYVSNSPSGVGVARSQAGMTALIEDLFHLPRMATDDTTNVISLANGTTASDIGDMINLNNSPAPYVPLATQGYTGPTCK
jgi:hypothetical protein